MGSTTGPCFQRNHNFDFVSVYGSLEPGKAFGFRYSGHHFDLSFTVAEDGTITDLPTFLGRTPPHAPELRKQTTVETSRLSWLVRAWRRADNPLIVPQMTPPVTRANEGLYLQWRNMAGVPQFPDATMVVLEAAKVLDAAAYVPLNQWESTPATGGLTLKDEKTVRAESSKGGRRRRRAQARLQACSGVRI